MSFLTCCPGNCTHFDRFSCCTRKIPARGRLHNENGASFSAHLQKNNTQYQCQKQRGFYHHPSEVRLIAYSLVCALSGVDSHALAPFTQLARPLIRSVDHRQCSSIQHAPTPLNHFPSPLHTSHTLSEILLQRPECTPIYRPLIHPGIPDAIRTFLHIFISPQYYSLVMYAILRMLALYGTKLDRNLIETG